MDLFTYLMAKNGNNTSVHGDLFSYLLGKGQSQTQTISGVTIYIPDAKKLISFMMTKESTQETNILPSGYTQVDYIESSGLESIDTGVNAKGTLHLSMEFETATELQGKAIFGGRTTSSSKTYCFWSTGNDTFRTDYNTETRTINVVNTAGKFLVDKNRGTTTIKSGSNIYTETQTNSTFTSEVPITLFACNSNGSIIYYSSYKLYKCNIYDDDVLVRQFIPCYRNSDNEVGLYDLVNDVFYTNQGTGAFTYGSVAQIPNPDYPQEVNVVEGYRNLFDKENISWYRNASATFIPNSENTDTTRIRTTSFSIQGGKTYKVSGVPDDITLFRIRTYNEYNGTYIDSLTPTDNSFILDEQVKYIHLLFSGSNFTNETNTLMANADIQIVEGSQELPYVPYGNNYVTVNVSDGNTTNNYPIPLNNNIIAGIGEYKDELKVDKSGNVFINKKTGKVILDGTETFTSMGWAGGKHGFRTTISDIKIITSSSQNSNCISNYYKSYSPSDLFSLAVKNYGVSNRANQSEIIIRNDDCENSTDLQTWLSTHNTEVYYVLETPQPIDLNTTVDIELFKGVNNITNSEDGYMTIEYK